MPLPTGTLKMSDVNAEIGNPSTQKLNIDNADVRLIAEKPTPETYIAYSDLRGKAFSRFITIASNQNNIVVNKSYIMTNTGWNGTSNTRVVITINSGVIVGSTSYDSPALSIDSSNFGTGVVRIELINNGTIWGAGGPGGVGGGTGAGSPGLRGGTALSTTHPITVTNNGAIYGGSGGGGGGGGYYYSYAVCDFAGGVICTCTDNTNVDGCPPAFPGDPCYWARGCQCGFSNRVFYFCNLRYPTAVVNGGYGGTGIGSNNSNNVGGGPSGGGGGSGGNGGGYYGAAGAGGGSGSSTGGGTGGPAGYYIIGNMNVVWKVNGTRAGTVR